MSFLSLIAQLGLDATGFKVGLKQSESAVKGFSQSVNSNIKGALVGAFGIGAAIAATKSTVDYASSINDMAARMDIGVEAAQGLSYAVKQTGSNQGELESALKKTAIAQQEALGGNEEMLATFKRLGVSADDLKTKRFDDVFLKISKSQENAVQSGRQLTDVVSVMGKTGYKLLPAMREGLAGASDEARKLGLVMNADTISQLDDLGDRAETLALRMTATLGPAIIGIVNSLMAMFDAFRIVGKGIGNFYGTLSSGAGFKAAILSIGAAYKEVQDEAIAAETARLIKGNRRGGSAVGEPEGSAATLAKETAGKLQSSSRQSSSDSLARIGGFTTSGDFGLVSLAQESKRHTRLLSDIKSNTKAGPGIFA